MADPVASPAVRIAHISDCYAPRTGGIETQVRSLALAQAQAGHDVHVITATPGHGPVRSGLDSDGPIAVHRVAARLPAELPIHPRMAHHVGSILQRIHPDVAHIHTGLISPFAWGGLRVAHRLQMPRVVTVHSMWGAPARVGHRASLRMLPWSGSVVSAVSAAAAQRIERALSIPVAVLPNGIDTHAWPARVHEPRPGRLVIVSVLRLAPRKRARALVDVIAAAATRLAPDIRVHATLIGDGPERTRLERHITAQGWHEVITLSGRRSPDEIREYFANSDLFVQASIHESFGIAALEARTSGLPVIAREQTGAGEFIHDGVNGLLVPDDHGLIEAVVRLGQDHHELARMNRVNVDNPPEQAWSSVLGIADDLYASAGA